MDEWMDGWMDGGNEDRSDCELSDEIISYPLKWISLFFYALLQLKIYTAVGAYNQ